MKKHDIPFSRPNIVGKEKDYLRDVADRDQLAGGGVYTQKCQAWLEENLGTQKAILTPSCTAAIEMAAILLDIGPGDEVIMPSFTFVSVANAVVLRQAQPVFVDIDPLTLNVDVDAVEAACTPNTKAIIIVHYAGVACDMDRLTDIARGRGIALIEDSAHAIMSTYGDQPLGSIGDLGCLSFHHTKNVSCGEGGALLINNPELIARAEVVRDKGTNRQAFLNNMVDKYSWVDVGSSFLLGEIPAAFLLGQLEKADDITARRRAIVGRYVEELTPLATSSQIHRLIGKDDNLGNGHIYYLLANSEETRGEFIRFMSNQGIEATFHYVPLHLSAAGKKYGRVHGSMAVTEHAATRIVRLPVHSGMSDDDVHRVISATKNFFGTALS